MAELTTITIKTPLRIIGVEWIEPVGLSLMRGHWELVVESGYRPPGGLRPSRDTDSRKVYRLPVEEDEAREFGSRVGEWL